jgi:hypothetical protein
MEGDPELVSRGLFMDFLDMTWFRKRWNTRDWAKVLEETQVAEAIASATIALPRPRVSHRPKAKTASVISLQ